MNGLTRLLEFLEFLKQQRVIFTLEQSRDDALMVSFALVGERDEVEFFDYQEEEYSVFTGDEGVELGLDKVRARIIEDRGS